MGICRHEQFVLYGIDIINGDYDISCYGNLESVVW